MSVRRPPNAPYDRTFYALQRAGSRTTAEVVVPIVVGWTRPRSVVDVGCGVGTWVRAFRREGVDDVLGVDGDHVPPDTLEVPAAQFVPLDLARPFDLGRTFDLAVSLEVAEHLPPSAADGFVAALCRLAPVVLFSAAIPGQGGTGHVNEAWPEAWARRFDREGFRWSDPLRLRLWDVPGVEPWYAQNLLLFHDPRVLPTPPWGDGSGPSPATPWPRSLVHPWIYERHLLTGPRAVRRSWRALRRAIRARLFGREA